MTSRGMISARQRTNSYRPDGAIAAHVLATTFHDERVTVPVKQCKAAAAFRKGNVEVEAGSTFYLVESSKFAQYFYVVVIGADRQYQCSATDERVAERCCDQVREYRFQASLKKVSASYRPAEVA